MSIQNEDLINKNIAAFKGSLVINGELDLGRLKMLCQFLERDIRTRHTKIIMTAAHAVEDGDTRP